MIQRRLPLARSKRVLLGTGALICYVAAIALAPTNVRSQLEVRAHDPQPDVRARTEAPLTAIVPEGDAFAPRAALDDDDSQPASPAPPLRPALPRLPAAAAVPLPRPSALTHVTAIATGTRPTAVIESGDSTRVVTIGDPLDGSTIASMTDDSVSLSNGRRLELEPASGR